MVIVLINLGRGRQHINVKRLMKVIKIDGVFRVKKRLGDLLADFWLYVAQHEREDLSEDYSGVIYLIDFRLKEKVTRVKNSLPKMRIGNEPDK